MHVRNDIHIWPNLLTYTDIFSMGPQKMATLNFTMKIPGSDKLRDSRYVTCMNDVNSKTRFLTAAFKQMESIPAQGSCPGLSTNEDNVNEDPLYNGFFCPPGLKLNKLKNNNLCCKCYRQEGT